MLGEAGRHRVAIGEVGAQEGVARVAPPVGLLEQRQARFLQRRVVVVVDDVEADHVVAALHQRLGDMKADEACIAGDENLHGPVHLRSQARGRRLGS